MFTIADVMDHATALFVFVALAVVIALIYSALRTTPHVTFVDTESPQFFITRKGRPSMLLDARTGATHALPIDAQRNPLSIVPHSAGPLVFFSLPADHNLEQHSHRYATDDFLTAILRAIDPSTKEEFTLPSPQIADGKFTGIHRLTLGAVSLEKNLFLAIGHRRADPQRLELPLRSLVAFTRDGDTRLIDIGKNERYFFDRQKRVIIPLANVGDSSASDYATTLAFYNHCGAAAQNIQLPGIFIAASPDLRRAATLTMSGQGGATKSAINLIDIETRAVIYRVTSEQAPSVASIAAAFTESHASLPKNKPIETAMDFHKMTGQRCVVDAALNKIYWLDWNARSNIPAVRLNSIDLRSGVEETIVGVDKIPQPRFQEEAADGFTQAAREAIGNRACSILPMTANTTHLTIAIFYNRYRVDPTTRSFERFRLPTSDDGRGDTIINRLTHDGQRLLAKTNLRIAMNDANVATVVPQPDGGVYLCRTDAEPQRLGGNDCTARWLGDGSIVVYNDTQASLVQSDGTQRVIFNDKIKPPA